MTMDPEKFGQWRAQLFVAAVAVVIVATLIQQFLVLQQANPVVLGWVGSFTIIPLGGPVVWRVLRRNWKDDS